jgi:hypothetical protein
MMPSPPDNELQPTPALRIAVILGAGGSGRDLLERVLPLLGDERDVEMQGVFIEEAEIRYAAELPFVQELCRVTFNVREFTSDQFERTLALRVRTARRALELLASRAGIRHSFRNVRGTALSLLRETAESSDVTVFEPARLLAAGSPAGIRRRNIVAVVTDPVSACAVVRVALRLAGGREEMVSVVLLPAPGVSASDLDESIQEVLNGRPIQTRLAGGGGAPAVAEVSRKLGASMLVLPASAGWLEPAALRRLRVELRCPICLVRRWKEGVE